MFVCMGFYDTFNSYGHTVLMTGQENQVPQLYLKINNADLIIKTMNEINSQKKIDIFCGLNQYVVYVP